MFVTLVTRTTFLVLVTAAIQGCSREGSIASGSSGAETTNVAHSDDEHAVPSSFASLVASARERSRTAWRNAPGIDPSSALARMQYDEHRRIRFRPEASLFRGSPGNFEFQFFHLGGTSRTPIEFSVVEDGVAHPYAYDRTSFVFGDEPLPDAFVAPAYSGFRVHALLNTDAYRDEFLVFQGASYFRAVARSLAYGLSARGLAIDTGTAHPEEFPVFTSFEIVRPAAGDDHVWVLASLTSPHAEGAYAFRVTPGDVTEIEVTTHLFFREGIEVLGIAPLTSMFLFGEDRPARGGDFRPEVHDSDTLVVEGADGERLARPLRNPGRTTVSSLRLPSPRGFGLEQRDREFDHYQDLESRYHERPSAWVTPLGDWGPGAVRLLEIATELETDDNIAAMWVPDVVPVDGLVLRYRLSIGRSFDPPRAARAAATRIATPMSSVTRVSHAGTRFIVDFVGDGLADARDVAVSVSATGARVVESHVEPNPFTGGVRASFELADESADVELRAFLRSGGDVLGETWSYLWQPTR